MQTLKKNKKFISNIKFNNLVKFDDVRMPEKFQVLYFSPDFPDNIETLDFLAVQDLDGDFVMSYLMETD
jgi:hypothetical protein